MGKQPNDFVPVKYASYGSESNNQYMNLLIGGLFAAFLFQIYRSMHGKGGPGKGAGGSGQGGSGGGFGQKGGGGIGDLFKYGSSNV